MMIFWSILQCLVNRQKKKNTIAITSLPSNWLLLNLPSETKNMVPPQQPEQFQVPSIIPTRVTLPHNITAFTLLAELKVRDLGGPVDEWHAQSPSCTKVWVLEGRWILRKGIMVDDGGFVIVKRLAKKPLLKVKKKRSSKSNSHKA